MPASFFFAAGGASDVCSNRFSFAISAISEDNFDDDYDDVQNVQNVQRMRYSNDRKEFCNARFQRSNEAQAGGPIHIFFHACCGKVFRAPLLSLNLLGSSVIECLHVDEIAGSVCGGMLGVVYV